MVTAETTTVTPGVGAWERPPFYAVSTAGPTVIEAAGPRVSYAVRSIQTSLNGGGFTCPNTGVYDTQTTLAVTRFQTARGTAAVGPIDGIAGRLTCHALFRPLAWWFEVFNDRHVTIPNHYLAGVIAAESGWDPGAQGFEDAGDRGLAQINAGAHPDVSDATAYGDPVASIVFACHRLQDGFRLYGMWRYAIAYYNDPLGAQQWARGGTPSTALAKYVGNVMTFAAAGG